MKKIFLIGWKDVRLAFRDRAALILMLLAPFLLTLGLGFVTGRFSSSTSSGISDIPVILVNQDKGLIGNSLVGLFSSPDLKGLIAATESNDPSAARKQVDADLAAAAIIIPPGFTSSIIVEPGETGTGKTVQIELYINPTRPTSVGVIKTILDDFVSRIEVGRIAGQVVVTQLLSQGLIQEQDAPTIATRIVIGQANSAASTTSISLKSVTNGGKTVPFDVLAYIAPGMALMFLMYTVSYGGRTLLAERTQGTLPRLLISPTSTSQVLGGKVFGIFLTGAAQMLILIFASTLLFNLQWGRHTGCICTGPGRGIRRGRLGNAYHRDFPDSQPGLHDRLCADAHLCDHGWIAGQSQ
jgi:ABC-2 type transport system permease protein